MKRQMCQGVRNFPRLPLIIEHWDRTEQNCNELSEVISQPTEPSKPDYKSSEHAVNNYFNFSITWRLRFHLTLFTWVWSLHFKNEEADLLGGWQRTEKRTGATDVPKLCLSFPNEQTLSVIQSLMKAFNDIH